MISHQALVAMSPSYKAVPETSDDQVVTKHFSDKTFIRLAVIRAIRYCHYIRSRRRHHRKAK
jgi:hypothetical protein